MPIFNPTTLRKSGSSPIAGDVQLVQGANVTLTQSGNQITIASTGGGGGSSTKGIVEVDFGTSESDIATVTVSDAGITAASYPSTTMYALATTDHDADDYMVEELSPYITNIVPGVSFDIAVRAPNLTWGKYKVTYLY